MRKKLLVALALTAVATKTGHAAPLQLKNKIVFTRDKITVTRTGGRVADETVWTMNGGGGEQKRVWRVPKGYGRFGGFSRDGKRAISYNRFNLYVHDLETKRFRRVLLWSSLWHTSISSPSFSPDGKSIICVVGGSFGGETICDILCLNVKKTYRFNKRKKLITKFPLGIGNFQPSWNPDGKRIVFLVGSVTDQWKMGGNWRATLCIAKSDGANAKEIITLRPLNYTPAWNPQGNKLVFVRQADPNFEERSDASLWSTRGWPTQTGVFLINTDGTGEISLTHYDSKQEWAQLSKPQFSPRGTQVAWTENNTENNGIYRINTDGTNLKKLTDGNMVQWVW